MPLPLMATVKTQHVKEEKMERKYEDDGSSTGVNCPRLTKIYSQMIMKHKYV